MSSFAEIDEFAENLKEGPNWYDLGVFLFVRTDDLDTISRNYRLEGTTRCLIELYKCVTKARPLSWERVAETLKRLGFHSLAEKIERKFIQQAAESIAQSEEAQVDQLQQNFSANNDNFTRSQSQAELEISHSDSFSSPSWSDCGDGNSGEYRNVIKLSAVPVPSEVSQKFLDVTKKFLTLTVEVHSALRRSNIHLEDLQHVISTICNLDPLSGEEATLENVLRRLSSYYCFWKLDTLEFLVDSLLRKNKSLQKNVKAYKKLLDKFKMLAEMRHLAHLVKARENCGARQKTVVLKLRQLWSTATIKRFEKAMQEIFEAYYDCGSNITVKEGCICVSWFIPEKCSGKSIELIAEDKDFLKLIGVLFLHIGDSVVCDFQGDGCEMMEAAMLQAVELKNTRAIEIFLLLGCDPEVATLSECFGITNIIHIRDSSKTRASVEHKCLFGHNKHIQAIINHTGDEDQQVASDVRATEKMQTLNLFREIDLLRSDLIKKGEDVLRFKKLAEMKVEEAEELERSTAKTLKEKEEKLEGVLKLVEETEQQKMYMLKALKDKEEKLEMAWKLANARVEKAESLKMYALEKLTNKEKELQEVLNSMEAKDFTADTQKDDTQKQLEDRADTIPEEEEEMKKEVDTLKGDQEEKDLSEQKIIARNEMLQNDLKDCQSQLETETKEKIEIATKLDQATNKLQELEKKLTLMKASLNRELLIAASTGKKEEVIRLILSEADVNCNEIDKDQRTPLHYASKGGYSEVVEELLTRGANPTVGDRLKKTPLHFGSEYGHTGVVQSLVSHDAAIDSQTNDRKTPLHLAAAGGHTEIVQFLLDKGATCNTPDRWKKVPLHYASEKGYTEVVKRLLSRDPNVGKKDRNNSTAIHLASGGGHTKTVEALLEHTTELSVIEDHDKWGHSPLNWALLGGHTDTAKCLISHGASIVGENEWDYSPILIAIVLNNKEMIEYFLSSEVTSKDAVQAAQQKFQLPPNWIARRLKHQIKYRNIDADFEIDFHPNKPKEGTK